jgi:plastocyanin
MAAAAAILLTAATGCSSSSAPTGGSSTVSGGPATVTVQNFSFNPGDLTVKTGTKVTWKFEDSVQHNVTAGDKSFKSNDESKGGSYSFTFNKAGSYDYTCTIHPQMHGSVTVK